MQQQHSPHLPPCQTYLHAELQVSGRLVDLLLFTLSGLSQLVRCLQELLRVGVGVLTNRERLAPQPDLAELKGPPRVHLWYLCDLLEVVVAFLQRSCSVQRLPHAGVFVQEDLAVLLHPVQHLSDRQVEGDPESEPQIFTDKDSHVFLIMRQQEFKSLV